MAVATKRLFVWGTLLALVAAGLTFAFWPRPVPVDMAQVTRGPLMVTIGEEGETRIKDVFALSAPVASRALRIELDPGDKVVAGETVVVRLEPADPAFLDLRTEAELQAAVRAAEAAEVLAKAELERVNAELTYAKAEVERARTLAPRGIIPTRNLDAAERAYRARQAERARAEADLVMRGHELARTQAQLTATSQIALNRETFDCVVITAPVDGEVLQVLHESEGVVQVGTPLVEIGDPADLEIVTDLLSKDAVRVQEGHRVIIENWGGSPALEGVVARVEPFGFTKVSALGIEEQRVNVIIDFKGDQSYYEALGHGFQVDTRIVTWTGEDVLKVPLTALFRTDGEWTLFTVRNGEARLMRVETGHSDGIETEILSGVEEGTQVIIHPSDKIFEGVRVTERHGR